MPVKQKYENQKLLTKLTAQQLRGIIIQQETQIARLREMQSRLQSKKQVLRICLGIIMSIILLALAISLFCDENLSQIEKNINRILMFIVPRICGRLELRINNMKLS